jgi:CRISPR-associated protein Cas2
MMVLVTYDVNTETSEGRRRLRRVAKACCNVGQRVQKSVFECLVDPAQWARLRHRLRDEIDIETDSVRFYFLGKNWRPRVEQLGLTTSFDQEGPLIL